MCVDVRAFVLQSVAGNGFCLPRFLYEMGLLLLARAKWQSTTTFPGMKVSIGDHFRFVETPTCQASMSKGGAASSSNAFSIMSLFGSGKKWDRSALPSEFCRGVRENVCLESLDLRGRSGLATNPLLRKVPAFPSATDSPTIHVIGTSASIPWDTDFLLLQEKIIQTVDSSREEYLSLGLPRGVSWAASFLHDSTTCQSMYGSDFFQGLSACWTQALGYSEYFQHASRTFQHPV